MKTIFRPLLRHPLLVIGLTVIVAVLAGWQKAPSYESRARLLFKLGDEFLQSGVGPDARTTGRILLAEATNTDVQILTSYDQYQQVVEELGVASFRPQGSDPNVPFGPENAIASLRDGLDVKSVENSAVVHLGYKHPDPARAQLVLKTLIDVYFRERAKVLGPNSVGVLETVRQEALERLDAGRQSFEASLRGASVQDMQSQLEIMRQQQMTLAATARDVRRRLNADKRQLVVIESEIANQPESKVLFTEPRVDVPLDRARTRLVELQVREQELLGKYTENSRAVTDIRNEIAELRRIVVSGGANDPQTVRRTGSNPIRDALEQQKIQLTIAIAGGESQLELLTQQESALRAELAELEARFVETDRLQDEFDIAEARYRNVDEQFLDYRIFSETQAARDANVRVIERPTLPTDAAGLSAGLRTLLGAAVGFLAGWVIAFWLEMTRSGGTRSTGLPDRRRALEDAGAQRGLAGYGSQAMLATPESRPANRAPRILGEFAPMTGDIR